MKEIYLKFITTLVIISLFTSQVFSSILGDVSRKNSVLSKPEDEDENKYEDDTHTLKIKGKK